MIKEDYILYIFGSFLILGVIFLLYKKRKAEESNNFNKKLDYFKYTFILFGFALIGLWLYLPSTPSLSTFGYPDNIQDIENKEDLLELLQNYNKAIVRTVNVIHWFIFLFIFWFLGSFIQLINLFKKQKI